jgi:hypothetical protein
MVHQIHEHGVARHGVECRTVLVLDRHLIQQIEHPSGDAISDLVIGDDVEERHDLVHVLVDASPNRAFRCSIRHRMLPNRLGDRRVG